MAQTIGKQTPSTQTSVIIGQSGPTTDGWHKKATALMCPKEYQLRYVRGVHAPLSRTPDYFGIGSLVHAGRARWFARGFRMDKATWDSVCEAIQEEAENQKLPVRIQVERQAREILRQFMKFWAAKPLPTPVATEYLLGPVSINGDNMKVTSKPDDVSRYPQGGNALWLGDCKTTSGDISDCIREYEQHGQMLTMDLLYELAPQGIKKLGPIAGIMLDIIVKPRGDSGQCKFSRAALVITPFQRSWFRKSLHLGAEIAAHIDWNTDAPRLVTACTRASTRTRVDCEFKPLCMFGSSAAGRYVMGEKGESLKHFKPDEERRVMPWL